MCRKLLNIIRIERNSFNLNSLKMATTKGKQQEIPMDIKEVLTNDEYGHDSKLQALRKLKSIFKPPDRIFSKVQMESLLQSVRIALETKATNKDFLFNYGMALVGFVGRDVTLDSELFYQIEHVLAEFKNINERQADALFAMLWNRLEENTKIHSNAALSASKQTVEKIVLDWVSTTGNPHLEFPARMAVASRELFENITSVLYEILVRSHGHGKVLEVTHSFISKVMYICGKEGKDFLGLYPVDCRHLVSLLMVDPEVFSESGRETVSNIYALLSDMFLRQKYKALILLSHYSVWVGPFKHYLTEVGVL